MAGGSRAARSSGNCRHLAVTVPLLVLAVVRPCRLRGRAGSRKQVRTPPCRARLPRVHEWRTVPGPSPDRHGSYRECPAPRSRRSSDLRRNPHRIRPRHHFRRPLQRGPAFVRQRRSASWGAAERLRLHAASADRQLRVHTGTAQGDLPGRLPADDDTDGNGSARRRRNGSHRPGAPLRRRMAVLGTGRDGFRIPAGRNANVSPSGSSCPASSPTNSPRCPEEDINSWYLGFFGQQLGLQEVAVAGPGKAWCEEGYIKEWRLLLYNRSGHC